jgi:hypothetical protein
LYISASVYCLGCIFQLLYIAWGVYFSLCIQWGSGFFSLCCETLYFYLSFYSMCVNMYLFMCNIHIAIILNPNKEQSWSSGSCIYNYLCNKCLSPLKLWVRIQLMARCIRYNIMWYVSDLRQVGGFLRFPPSIKTDHHDITDILLKVV